MRIQAHGLPAAVIASLLLSGCINMSTPPSQITGSPGPGLNYEEYTCARLADELGALAKREVPLAAAQERRVKASGVQALMIGSGKATAPKRLNWQRCGAKKKPFAKPCTPSNAARDKKAYFAVQL